MWLGSLLSFLTLSNPMKSHILAGTTWISCMVLMQKHLSTKNFSKTWKKRFRGLFQMCRQEWIALQSSSDALRPHPAPTLRILLPPSLLWCHEAARDSRIHSRIEAGLTKKKLPNFQFTDYVLRIHYTNFIGLIYTSSFTVIPNPLPLLSLIVYIDRNIEVSAILLTCRRCRFVR